MKKYSAIMSWVVAVILMFFVVSDIFSSPEIVDGIVYYTFNVPSKSWQELGWWFGLLVVSFSLIFTRKGLFGVLVKFLAAACSIGLVSVLFEKLYFSIVFLVSGESVLLAEPVVSVFSCTWGRVLGLILILTVSLFSIYEAFRR